MHKYSKMHFFKQNNNEINKCINEKSSNAKEESADAVFTQKRSASIRSIKCF